MRDLVALAVLVVLLLDVADCNPFLDRLRGEFPVRVDSSISASKSATHLEDVKEKIADPGDASGYWR